jgi:AraC-like DNA-binding protein
MPSETVLRIVATNHTPPRRPKPAATRRMASRNSLISMSRLATDLSLAELSAYVGMSKYHFIRTFKHTSGMTPHQYILGRRLRTVATALRATKEPVARVSRSIEDLAIYRLSIIIFIESWGSRPRRIGRVHEYRKYATARSECKADPNNDPGYCERFWKDYGNSMRGANGGTIPRMFDDLPICVAAFKARKALADGDIR